LTLAFVDIEKKTLTMYVGLACLDIFN